jgi:hypothetical protein
LPLIYTPPPSESETDIDINECDDVIDCEVEGELVDVSTLHTEIDLVSASSTKESSSSTKECFSSTKESSSVSSTKESSSSFTFIPIEEPEENKSTVIEEI